LNVALFCIDFLFPEIPVRNRLAANSCRQATQPTYTRFSGFYVNGLATMNTRQATRTPVRRRKHPPGDANYFGSLFMFLGCLDGRKGDLCVG